MWKYLGPIRLSEARAVDLHDCLRPLGLWRKRAITLPRLADAWLQGPPKTCKDVLKLPGCGKYAADSWAIFIEGRTDVEPNDGKLNWYLGEKDDRPSGQDGGDGGAL